MKDTPPTPPSASGLDAELLAELEMDGEPVVAALEEWLAYRRERKAKPYKTDRWLRAIAKWGPERAEAAIRHSMRMDWQGIFEPKAAPDPRFRRGRRGLSRSKDGGARYADVAMHESESV